MIVTHVLVIGAGPAGLSAACAASAAGARVTIVDSAGALGGQYWRHLPAERESARQSRVQHGWATFRRMSAAIANDPHIKTILDGQVWAIDRDEDQELRVHLLVGPVDAGRESRELRGDALVIATGAHDRVLPFPGWTLPGVFTAGAAQALAKGERIAIGDRVVISGAGPFLLPVASALRGVGARVISVHEASRVRTLARGWLRHPHLLPSFARKFGELIEYGWGHVVHGIPYRLGEGVVAAHGARAVEAVTVARLDANWAPIPGTERRINADAVCVGHGFIPRVELAVAAGCALEGGFVVVDDECRTTAGAVFAAGEVTGIGGADGAMVEGEIAGRAAAGRVVDAALLRRRRAARDFGRRLEDAHGIRAGWREWLRDETIVCRCEEVTFGALRRGAGETGQRSLRSIKLTTRAGLGVCQARICGRTVEQLLGTDPDGGLVDNRPIATPIRLAELSATPFRHADPGGSP